MARKIKVKRSEKADTPSATEYKRAVKAVRKARKEAMTSGKPVLMSPQKKSVSKPAKPHKYDASLEKKIKVDPFDKKDVKCKKCKKVKKGAVVSKKSGVCVECIIKGA